MKYSGFDSAWGGRQKGALCDLEWDGDQLIFSEPPSLVTWADATKHAETLNEDDHIIAVDQGLVVPNENGMRPVERKFASAMMSEFRCGAHASNRSNRSCYGKNAGIWRFLDVLTSKGYSHAPLSVPGGKGCHFFECYPHATILGLFDPPCVLKYKFHKKCPDDWATLLSAVRDLADAELSVAGIESQFPASYKQTKSNEDCLDAFLAAYTAAYWHRFGTEKSICIGSLSTGYMVFPCSSRMRPLLESVFQENEINPRGAVIGNVAEPSAAEARSPEVRTRRRIVYPPAIEEGEWDGEVDLAVNDPGCLWRKHNSWMDANLLGTHLLTVKLPDESGEPQLRFCPFRVPGHGMKPFDDDDRLEWAFIAEGTSNDNMQTYRAQFRFQPIQEIE